MPEAWIQPQEFKRILHDASDVGKETGANQIFPYVALTIDNGQAMAYGRSAYTVGWSFLEAPLLATHENTVLIPHDEAKDLGAAVGKTSAAKDASVWVNIEDGRVSVAWGNESIADLPGVEPEPGDIDSINKELELFRQAKPSGRTFFAMTIEVIKRLSKVRGKSPILDLFFTDIGNTVYVKVGSGFVGGFEAVDRNRVNDPEPMLFS